MRIYYCPAYGGQGYLGLGNGNVCMGQQVLETQGLLEQLAQHVGVHQEVPVFPVRLTAYYKALCKFDADHPDNLFHGSFALDGMSVAKTLLGWRDSLALSGWNGDVVPDGCPRIAALAGIEKYYEDDSIAVLLTKLKRALKDDSLILESLRGIEIVLCVSENLLPDYLKELFALVRKFGVTFVEEVRNDVVKEIEEIRFSQRWKAELWMSQLFADEYDVWINGDNRRLDNWLHMSGQPMAGSCMKKSNPQVTQMFLLAVQLFQRPLNVNILVQYLMLPECPLHWQLSSQLARAIVKEGGFCNNDVKTVIDDFINRSEYETPEWRKKNYKDYLPFDLCEDIRADFCKKDVVSFLDRLRGYASNRAHMLDLDDARVAQLNTVANLLQALLNQIDVSGDNLNFDTIQQWAQSLYDTCDYTLYAPQVGSRYVIGAPSNIVTPAARTIWCDFFGDVSMSLSTDFLSPFEIKKLVEEGVKLWNRENETVFFNQMLKRPLYMTTEKLAVVSCEKEGGVAVPKHPISLQIPENHPVRNGDALLDKMLLEKNSVLEMDPVDNHRKSDLESIKFDASSHGVKFRTTESYSSLELMLQNPFDYMMKYPLGFTDVRGTEIQISVTRGKVAHDVIEEMLLGEGKDYAKAFDAALNRVGALLLLPEYHLEKDRIFYQLERCVERLRSIIGNNNLKTVSCEYHIDNKNMKFADDIVICMDGYIDIVLEDAAAKKVIFDLKWTSTKGKYKKLLERNRAMQLAIYKALYGVETRTAYFEMPTGVLYTTDDFVGDNVEKVDPRIPSDIMKQIGIGYVERKKEIGKGFLETASGMPIADIAYSNVAGVFPLEIDTNSRKSQNPRNPKKDENKYSDYECFMK